MSKSIFSGLAGVAISILITSPQAAQAACGKVAVSKGDVKIESPSEKSGSGKAIPASVGAKVCEGDTIIAAVQSRAKIQMDDGNELNISPESRIKLETYEYKPADNKKKVMLNVLYGKVRAATREENMYNDKAKDGQANTFQVKTKSAVAGVRGTDFLTSFNEKTSKTEVVTFRGKVEVGTPGPGGAILNPVSVGANQKTETIPGVPPAPPKPVPQSEMKEMNMQTGGGVSARSSSGAGTGNSMASSSDLGTTDKNPNRGPSSEQAPTMMPPPPPPPPPALAALPVIPLPPTPPPTPPPGAGKVNITILVPQ